MADESKYPTRIAPYGLRIPPELKARIEQAASINSRSLHSEIIAALERSFPKQDELDAVETSLLLLKVEMGSDRVNSERLQRALSALDEDMAALRTKLAGGKSDD